MCRNEAPVDFTVRAVGKLARYLRALRDGANFTNAELADFLGVDVVTVRRAASGRSVPKRQLVDRWADACAGKHEKAVSMWRQARYQSRRVHSGRSGTALPNPDLISTPEMLSEALVELYERAGAPTFREMEERGGPFGVLPRNTARRIVLRQTLPVSANQFRAFLEACEVKRTKAWLDARDRISARGTPFLASQAMLVPGAAVLRESRAYPVGFSGGPVVKRVMVPQYEVVGIAQPRSSYFDPLIEGSRSG